MVPKRVPRQIRNQPLVLLPNNSGSFTREPAGTCAGSGSESTVRKVSVLFFQMISSWQQKTFMELEAYTTGLNPLSAFRESTACGFRSGKRFS